MKKQHLFLNKFAVKRLIVKGASRFLIALCTTYCSSAVSAAPVLIKEWGPYLDVAYELTYWDKAEIKEWREKREQEIGEPLAAYITLWNGKMAGSSDNSQAIQGNTRDAADGIHFFAPLFRILEGT